MIVPPRVGSSSGIVVNSGFSRTCGTRGLNRLLKPLMKPKHLDLALVGAHHHAVHGGVQGRGIAASRQNANTFHAPTAEEIAAVTKK